VTGRPIDARATADAARARLLADPTRALLLRFVQDAPDPVPVDDLASHAGVHITAVRQHLNKLIDGGLVVSERLDPTGRGRPRLAYRAAPLESDPYRGLSAMLSEAVRHGRTSRDQGRVSGNRDADATLSGVDLLRNEASRWGFAPEVLERRGDRVDIVLRACPFADVAQDDPDTICDLHLGLAEGLAEATADVEVLELRRVDPHAGGCRFRLRRI
jgi:predicted ArsR family transcriptional regulator